jgi:hypothetical protein
VSPNGPAINGDNSKLVSHTGGARRLRWVAPTPRLKAAPLPTGSLDPRLHEVTPGKLAPGEHRKGGPHVPQSSQHSQPGGRSSCDRRSGHRRVRQRFDWGCGDFCRPDHGRRKPHSSASRSSRRGMTGAGGPAGRCLVSVGRPHRRVVIPPPIDQDPPWCRCFPPAEASPHGCASHGCAGYRR